ncbi:serine-rich adhesin for platelets isoform X1 [Drosophila simulans]|uniref:serine-rich adhesin for platelets isoform X1 n=1 Tax=Drosophila simulans TaxID=7240 RepID=UPI00192D0378|nr:serine-rich adhesin for platelets isoform X1 [Drosophila simulans]
MESQKRPSLDLHTDVPAGSAAGGSGLGAAAEMSPTSGFLPDMPQWKKDLIQRRKTNVARTQAASITSPTDGSCGALAEANAAPGAIADFTEPATISSTSQKRNMIGSEEKSEKSSISNTNSDSTGGHHSVVAVSLSPDAAATTNVTVTPIPKQRSSLLNTRSQEREMVRYILSESGERDGEPESGEQPAGVVSSSRCGEVETGTIGSPSSSANQNPNPNHLKTKCKPGQSVAEGKPSAKETIVDNSKSCSKTKSISDKLQSNKFIIQQQQQQQQQQLSPTKVTVKPTMVAMQEMKKTTKQNGQHRHLAGKIGSVAGGDVDPQHPPTNPIPDSLDTGEDLSYGPGIVSKLRCRYLSLALRESRQQSSKQRLQRSTSLNTLLDRDDDEVEVEEPEVPNSQVRAKSTPPPILGAKPTPKPSSQHQRPVSLGANGTGSAVNPPSNSDQAQTGAVANGGTGSGQRSRHFKRGNEVMKRARSVEALLCEKSPWNSQRISTAGAASAAAPSPPAPKATAAAPSPVTSPTCVTIEDKIHNARERLHSGTDTAPPKRLTSIIDDTERPPPDLVKQTLKMFEASANRRPRAAHRSNGVGGVASKVANYKSIIKDQKQPSSAAATPPPPGMGFASSTPLRHVHPDIIPRQVDSPVSALSVMMRRMELQEPETPERETRDAEATPQSEAPSETERNDRDEGDGEVDDDNHNNNDDDHDDGDEGSDNNEQRDKMGAAAAGDKPKPSAESAAGGAQRSFAASTENAHVASGSSSSTSASVRKLSNNNDSSSGPAVTKQIGVIRPLFNSQGAGSTPLTSREIEKNRINEMKKSTATDAGGAVTGSGSGSGTIAGAGSGTSPTTSLDSVINTKEAASSETDASASPLWTLRKLRNQSQSAGGGSGPSSSLHSTENTSMVFNFSKSTKEVPDYIESDVVIYRRKRELPKPNEPGFVLLGDLSVETSTDTDYDDYSMCPPSPCDVEFENANIVIDGKSSIRQKPKESSFRVQFNDTLTSTFEYPSEASMTIEDPPYADPFGHVSKHHQMLLAEQMHLLQHQEQLELEQMHQLGLAPEQHHHVTVDEIIELPTSTAGHGHGIGIGHRAGAAGGGGTMLGNLPLGSTALGFYTPMKGTAMDNLFQLGVTRYALPESSSSGSSNGSHSPGSNGSSPAGAAGSRLMFNGNGSIMGIGEGLIKEGDLAAAEAGPGAADGAGASKKGSAVDEDDYHLTATPGAEVVYSEGTHKTDLLY